MSQRLPKAGCPLNLDPELNYWDYDQGPLVLRNTPLLNLRILGIPMLTHSEMAPALHTVLANCPTIKSLHLPFPSRLAVGIKSAIASIGRKCPRITELAFPNGCFADYMMQILNGLAPQSLESLYWPYFRCTDSVGMGAAWNRHSTTLRRIEGIFCFQVESALIQAGLTTCRALEIFRIHGAEGNPGRVSLMLEHAIKNEWVCSRLRELEIAVKLTLDGREPEYMADTSKATWTEDDRRHWQDLGKFYRKIGSLVNVEILVLKAVGQFRTPISHNQYRINYLNPSKTCLPGLLTLEDPAAGQIGYLTTLSGLNKLRDLRGSFVWTNQETIARLSEREVDWFVSHLPALKVATFIGDEDSGELAHSSLVLKLHQTLKERRPEIRICHVEPLVVPRQSYTSLH